jgi:SOS-response transcriptional repressor LexA
MVEKNKGFGEYFSRLLLDKEPTTPQYKVAEKLGVQQGTMSKLKNGALIPSDELAQKIIEVWDLDKDSFMEVVCKARQASGARFFRESKQKEEQQPAEVEVLTKPRLPITAAAGVLSDYLGGVLAHECEQMPVIRSMPDYDFTMLVKGNSMEPKYEGGDEIACKKVESIIEWGKTYVLATRDGAVLKRLYEAENGVRCVSYNHDEYPDFFVNGDDILGVYRVVGLIRI